MTSTGTPAVPGAIPGAGTGELTPLSPRVVALWRLGWAITGVVLLVPAILFAVLATDVPAAARVALAAAVAVGAVTATILVPSAMYRRWGYLVDDRGLELRHGIFVHRSSAVPHFRVQHIDIDQGPLDRWRRIVKLSVSTASADTDATLPGIDPAEAEALRTRILRLAHADDGV